MAVLLIKFGENEKLSLLIGSSMICDRTKHSIVEGDRFISLVLLIAIAASSATIQALTIYRCGQVIRLYKFNKI
jgi:hypothetical protein